MKYGVVVYNDTENIGDDIQSYAAAQLLPQVDYYVEREQIDIFRPHENEPVSVIMNGWYMHNKLAWPVSPCINPLYISMYFKRDDILEIGESFLDGIGKEDLCQYEPIGCRDTGTQRLLKEKGIQTWFSACLTLTLKPRYPQTAKKYIYLVNVSDKVIAYFKEKYPMEEIRIVDQSASKMVDHHADWEQRFKNVESLLTQYQNAKAVVTTRLHCAMPCLALKTPVLLLMHDDIYEKSRFEGLKQLVRHASQQEFLDGKVEFDFQDPTPNSDAYLVFSHRLEEQVKRFIERSKECTPEMKARFARYDQEWEKRAAWKNEQISRATDRVIKRWQTSHEWMEELTETVRKQEKVKRELEATIQEQERVKRRLEVAIQKRETIIQEKELIIIQYKNRLIVRLADAINRREIGLALEILVEVLKKSFSK